MDDKVVILDDSIKQDILRYPMVDLVRLLFPEHPVRRGVMRSPFRQDRNPSFSCFRGKNGISLGKDHSTGITYDNIMIYREAFPQFDYVEAVDRLSMLLFGRTAIVDYGSRERRTYSPQPKPIVNRLPDKEQESVLRVVKELPLSDSSVPETMKSYWRGRGISDSVITRYCCYCVLENTKRKGRVIMDKESGLPVIDKFGNPMMDDGFMYGIGQRNDIGGMVFRSPETASSKGFKGATSSFVSTFLSDGTRPLSTVKYFGEGDNFVHFIRYDRATSSIFINPTQGFSGISESAVVFALSFMSGFSGEMDARERKCAAAVLSSLNCPVTNDVVVVEGMFDGLSDRELCAGLGSRGAYDLLILNSISNLRWAVPFLSRHNRVVSMMDNDMSSGAGQKAFVQLSQDIESFSLRTGHKSLVFDGSTVLGNHKDLNDALMAGKGFNVDKKKA